MPRQLFLHHEGWTIIKTLLTANIKATQRELELKQPQTPSIASGVGRFQAWIILRPGFQGRGACLPQGSSQATHKIYNNAYTVEWT